jgi:hypothetical protein
VLHTVQTIQAHTTNPYGLMATPALDLTPTNRLPFLVTDDQDRTRTEQLRTGTYNNTTVCVYDGTPAITTRTGKSGNHFGLCTPCAAFSGNELRQAGACTVYPGLCTITDGEDGTNGGEDGRHFDHGSHAIGVPGLEVEGDPEIWAEFTHISAGTPPHIGFMGFDLTPDQARVKARELRQFADELDVLADQTATALALYDVRTVRETAGPAFAEILTIVEDAIVRDGADPAEVFDHVLRLMARTRAENTENTAAA